MEQPSKSRKVKGYLKAYRKWLDLVTRASLAHRDATARYATLTGSQLGEAERLKKEEARQKRTVAVGHERCPGCVNCGRGTSNR